MGAYWGKVAKRAAREAATAVFISRERAVISLLLQLAVGLLIFIALGETEAKPDVRIASALAPLLLFPAVFVWKMICVPASMHGDLLREEEGERKGHVFYLSQLYLKEVEPENHQQIYYGFALPPEDWLNAKLEEFDFRWRVRIIHGVQYVTEDVA